MTIRPLTLMVLLSATALVAACGKTGELTQPAPLFGAKAKADYQAKQAQAASDRAAKRAEPQATAADPADQPLTQAPYAAPIDGHSDPFGHANPGSLPNPGTASDR